MDSTKISVIILNAFELENLAECLESLCKVDYSNFEIIVVDCLTPRIGDFIEENYPIVKLVHLDEDIGPSSMHNIGIIHSDKSSKYVVFLDNDTIVDIYWLTELLYCIESDDTIGAVQSRILLYNRPDIINSDGNKANYLCVGWPNGYGNKVVYNDSSREISFPSGASMILRKSLLEKIGMFDEDYFIYADDMDVGLRIKLSGFKVYYCPNSTAYHKYTFLKNKRNFYYLNRNRILTFFKLYNKNTYLLLLPAFIFYELFIIGFAILNGLTRDLAKAYMYILKNYPAMRLKRSAIEKYKVISDRELVKCLESTIDFPAISQNPGVKYILNPFLKTYKNILLNVLE